MARRDLVVDVYGASPHFFYGENIFSYYVPEPKNEDVSIFSTSADSSVTFKVYVAESALLYTFVS